jgi:ABC-type transporter Mla MlaB component
MQASASAREFIFYMHDGARTLSLEIAGIISDGAARELATAWKSASSVADGQSLIVDLSYVTQVDEAGCRLLREWYKAGAQLVAKTPLARSIVASITGQPFDLVAETARDHTWRPLHASVIAS